MYLCNNLKLTQMKKVSLLFGIILFESCAREEVEDCGCLTVVERQQGLIYNYPVQGQASVLVTYNLTGCDGTPWIVRDTLPTPDTNQMWKVGECVNP